MIIPYTSNIKIIQLKNFLYCSNRTFSVYSSDSIIVLGFIDCARDGS